MTKKRVHELAKELNIESKEVIKRLNDLGLEVKSPLSMVEDQYADKLRNQLSPAKKTAPKGKKQPKGKRNYDKGPGVVDRVPSRPPDRRYDERKDQVKPKKNEGQKNNKQKNDRQQQVKGQGNRPQGKPHQGKPQGKKFPGKHQGKGKDRQGGRGRNVPQKDKPISIPKMDPVVSAQAKAKAQERPRNEQRVKDSNFTSKDRWLEEQDRREQDKKFRKQRQKKQTKKREKQMPGQPMEKKPVTIGETITVQELAEKLRRTAADVIKTLMGLGVMATINQEIDSDTATLVANEFGYEVIIKQEENIEETVMAEPEEDEENLQPRPPVVTVMGHVDHGKTSLLDAIREAKVTATEAGGITQHIGAYQVEKDGKKITFLDTPGHAAFTAMRARGAKVTDIAILVVAADDGVMPQTIEAINHAKAAEVPIIVAINKMDKPDANPDRVRQELAQHGLVVEQWGGDVISVEVSAIKRTGLEELLEMILLVAEISELKANPNRKARGTVVEAKLDKGRGPVATVLVQKGTLQVGDPIVVGTAHGRVRAMMDYMGRRVKEAGPSTPVEVLGLNSVPEAGDVFVAVDNEKIARQVAEGRVNKKKEEEHKKGAKLSLDDLFKSIQEGKVKDLPIVIKADVQGSAEALTQAINNLSNDEVKVTVVHGGVGAITETDIMLASASNAIVIGFNVRPDVNARKAAETEKVDVRTYRVIYDVIEDIKAAMSGLLEPEYKEVVIGRLEVRKTFKVSKIGTIAGCYVTEGKVTRDSGVRLIRDGVVIHEGKIDSLKRFKDDVKEVAQGYECGITIDKFNDIQDGDIIEAYVHEEVKREL